MSSPRDDGFYGSYGKARRSPPGADSGLFRTGQGGRPVLPPISSAFPTSRSPAPIQHSNQYSQQRASPGRNEFNAAPYGHQWPSNAPSQPHPSSFGYYDSYDPRYGATQYSSARASQSLTNDTYDSHRLPPMSMAPLAHREEEWPTSPFTPHMPFSDEIRSPTASYPSQYTSHQPQQQSYPYPVIPSDTRNMHFSAPSYNQHSTHMGQSSAERVVVSRGKEAHPYARSTATPQSVGYGAEAAAPIEEPVIKKKRKRADAAQLKVLNETYQRTAFPSTEERQALATELDMPPRSVQIWFQNKRQSDRQSSRQLSTTATPAALLDDSQVSVGGYGSNTSMNQTTAGPLYLSRSSRDHSHHRPRNQDESVDPRKWSNRRY